MSYKKIHLSDAPRMRRNRLSRFERTDEWKLMKADIDKGLKPTEALQIILTAEDKKKYHITNRRTIARFLQKYLADRKIPYAVKSFHRDGLDFYVVQYTSKK